MLSNQCTFVTNGVSFREYLMAVSLSSVYGNESIYIKINSNFGNFYAFYLFVPTHSVPSILPFTFLYLYGKTDIHKTKVVVA